MDTMETDRLVDDYLRRLEHAAAHMQRARRTELIAEIRCHIETALREEQAAEKRRCATCSISSEREEIVEAAEPPPDDRRVGKPGDRRAHRVDRALHQLAGRHHPGLCLPGVVRQDKVIGAMLLLLAVVLLGLVYMAAGPVGARSPPGEIALARRRKPLGTWARGARPLRRRCRARCTWHGDYAATRTPARPI